MIGQAAIGAGDVVLRQQQLQRCLAADGIGRTQQGGELGALRGESFGSGVATGLQFVQRLLLPRQRGLGPGQLARIARHALVGLAEGAAGPAALALDAAALAADLVQFALDLLEPALGLAAVLGRGGRGLEQEHPQHEERGHGGPACGRRTPVPCRANRHPSRAALHGRRRAHASRLLPVISAGFGTPSRSSIVGARSRSAPPRRNVASLRAPT